MLTVTQVLSQFLIRFPEAGSTQAQVLFDATYRELAAACELRNTTGTISAVAGQRSYALPDGCMDVLQVYYQFGNDTTQMRELLPTTADQYAATRWSYRVNEDNIEGGPMWFWVESRPTGNGAQFYLTVDPIPDTTYSGGYPQFQLNYNVYTSLSGSDTIPFSMPNETAILQGMFLKWSQMQSVPALIQMYAQQYDIERQKLIAHVKSTSQMVQTTFGVSWGRRRAV